uniref:EGF-like domain-containing protein n=1 Tax=Syphacia muris TaxID=451379 RepID=A0A0N5AUY1_9BILA
MTINRLKKQIKDAEKNRDTNCTICWNEPCKHGTCVPLNDTDFRLFDYKGKLCDEQIYCRPDSCGQNARCYVANHQINCICENGYTGTAASYFNDMLNVVEACATGDPHYKTFDKQYYEYMGTCPYYFVKPCNNSAFYGDEYFEVKARNQMPNPTARYSYISEVEVLMRGNVIHVDNKFQMTFNGIRQQMPFYYPSKDNLSITYTYSTVLIDNHEQVVVRFTGSGLCVQIPDTEQFRGANKLCGLAGNFDGDCTNDFKTDMSRYDVQSCSNSYKQFTEEFGDLWITTDFENGRDACLLGTEVDKLEAKKKCQVIEDALNGEGPFAPCRELISKEDEQQLSNCVYDVCLDEALFCTSLSAFAKSCQKAIPNTALSWRKEVGCPEISCPINSSFKTCAAGCPLTCSEPNQKPVCSKPCMEGCECDPGFYLDQSNPNVVSCVPIEQCGCTDNSGNYHRGKLYNWLTDNCSVLNKCVNGSFVQSYMPCGRNAECSLNEHAEAACKCKEGFIGNGYDCEDINECLNPETCNANHQHGTCHNTNGSYYCECDPSYRGDNCEFYLPYRHCADLKIYHNITEDGFVLTILTYTNNLYVYCDMTTLDGGWTLMSSSKSNLFTNKTYQAYVEGFGEPGQKEVWLGLENIYRMTKETKTRDNYHKYNIKYVFSLRIELHRCAGKRKKAKSTYCIYPEFGLLDKNEGYAVVIPYDCENGTENTYQDGWARWDDDKNHSNSFILTNFNYCSNYYMGTGWWFDNKRRCGPANLNGIRYDCDAQPSSGQLTHYLKWNSNTVNFAEMYLRPEEYPNYESNVKATEFPKTTDVIKIDTTIPPFINTKTTHRNYPFDTDAYDNGETPNTFDPSNTDDYTNDDTNDSPNYSFYYGYTDRYYGNDWYR